MKPGLSAAVITFNEEENIRDCLVSLSWADEIVVLDSGSTDGTVEIAREFTDRVHVEEWRGYVEQKNAILDRCQGRWILSLDADERATEGLRREIVKALGRKDDHLPDGFLIPRKSFYLGRWISHGGWYPDRKLRLFRKGRGHWVGDDLHERVDVPGRVEKMENPILHYTYRDLSDHMAKMDRYTTISARSGFRKGRRANPGHLLVHPLFKFLRMYFLRRGFLDGKAGLIISVMGAYYVFLKYAKLWEMSRRGKKEASGEADGK